MANSHKHTRLVNYGRKPSRHSFAFKLWFIIPMAACLAFIAALILGNTLGEMVPPSDTEASEPAAEPAPVPPGVGGVNVIADFVSLRSITYGTATEVAKQIADGASAVSMELFDTSGRPYYQSSVASSFGKPCGELTLKNTFKPISERSLYASVLFPSSLLSVTDKNRTATESAYEATLAKELFLSGADEIVVYFSPLGSGDSVVSDTFWQLMTEYISTMRIHSSGLRVGIVLSVTDIGNHSGSGELEKLCATADFCAVDLTGFGDTDKLTSSLLTIAPTAMRHDMRFIISEGGKSEEFIAAQAELFDKLGAKNIQYAEIFTQ